MQGCENIIENDLKQKPLSFSHFYLRLREIIAEAETAKQYVVIIALQLRGKSAVSNALESLILNEAMELVSDQAIVGNHIHAGVLLIISRVNTHERQQLLFNYQHLINESDNLVTAHCGYICVQVNSQTFPDQLIAAASELTA